MMSKSHAENLIEARQVLELAAVQMAVENRSLEDLRQIRMAQVAFYNQTLDQGNALDEDLLFHLKVVSAGNNQVLKSLFIKILPELFSLFEETKEADSKKFFAAIHEHDHIIQHIENQDKQEAVDAMEYHLAKWTV